MKKKGVEVTKQPQLSEELAEEADSITDLLQQMVFLLRQIDKRLASIGEAIDRIQIEPEEGDIADVPVRASKVQTHEHHPY